MRKAVLLATGLVVLGTLFFGLWTFQQKLPISALPKPPEFKLQPGYQIELVADKFNTPIACAWDAQGVLWVTEARGRVLRGNEVFAEGLRAPSGVLPLESGVLVPDRPSLWLLREGGAKEDLAARLPADAVGTNILWALDNWVYTAGGTHRFRLTANGWTNEPTYPRGENGLTQDSSGRFYYCAATDALRVDLLPRGALDRNPNHRSVAVMNLPLTRNAPLPSPRSALLYRGGALPLKAELTAFVCDPSARLVRCLRLHRSTFARDVTQSVVAETLAEGAEFLSTADARFAPVHLTMGPDGALYVVDSGGGAVYRISHNAYPLEKIRALEPRDLSHPHAWWRDAAQRRVAPEPRRISDSVGRVHTLWALDRLGKLDWDTLSEAVLAEDPLVATTALRLCEPRLNSDERPMVLGQLFRAATATNLFLETQLHLLLALGATPGTEAEAVIAELAARGIHSALNLHALMAAVPERELELLERLVADPRCGATASHQQVIAALATAAGAQGKPERIAKTLEIAAFQLRSNRATPRAILQGLGQGARRMTVNVRPQVWAALEQSADSGLQAGARELRERFQ